jgi:hypothetical protein
MLLHFSLFTMPTHFKSINTVSRFWLTDCHLVSHTLLDKNKKKNRRLVYSTGTETTRRKRMGQRKGCNGSTTMPLESTSMKPSTASSRAAARVGSINERQAFTIRRGISLGQAVLPLALCANKFKILSRNN